MFGVYNIPKYEQDAHELKRSNPSSLREDRVCDGMEDGMGWDGGER